MSDADAARLDRVAAAARPASAAEPPAADAASPRRHDWPAAHELRTQWQLDPAWTYLNHGGYGGCPTVVLEAQVDWIRRLERQPIHFIARQLEGELDRLLTRLGAFVGADPANLAFVTNATVGVNTVLRSLRFEPGEEILVTSHSYPSIFNAVEWVAKRWGAKMVVADVPFPIAGPDDVMAAVAERMSDRTRLLVVDHVTSPTGLVLPIDRLAALAQARGVEVLIDGAHGPGMLPLDLASLGADYYTGNCHKWMCAPKGAAFLYVAPQHHERIVPLSISLGWIIQKDDEPDFHAAFKYTGTADPSPVLAIDAAMDFFESLPGGWRETRRRNHDLLLQARALLSEELGAEQPAPEEMLGSLCTLPLPDGRADLLEQRLVEEFKIEVPVLGWPFRPKGEAGPRWFRISPHVYNDLSQYAHLAKILKKCLADE
jgi:isopenicillin-N epimerase